MTLSTGQILKERYRIVKLLGQGGFGAVYRAWDIILNSPCALKENFEISASGQKQFLTEARLLANLRHPNLPRVTEYFVLPGQGQYLVMDYVEGEDLSTILEKYGAPLPEAQVLTWIGQVCEAIEYLHAQEPPIIHRDIKPANIKINSRGQAILVDFGIAKVYDVKLKTTMGARAVTPGYSPPEQYGLGTTDARSDIYAIGATLYNLITNQEPVESIQRTIGVKIDPPRKLIPHLSIKLEKAILKAVELVPERRFHTITEFVHSLPSPLTPRKSAKSQTYHNPVAGSEAPAEISGMQETSPTGSTFYSSPTGGSAASPATEVAPSFELFSAQNLSARTEALPISEPTKFESPGRQTLTNQKRILAAALLVGVVIISAIGWLFSRDYYSGNELTQLTYSQSQPVFVDLPTVHSNNTPTLKLLLIASQIPTSTVSPTQVFPVKINTLMPTSAGSLVSNLDNVKLLSSFQISSPKAKLSWPKDSAGLLITQYSYYSFFDGKKVMDSSFEQTNLERFVCSTLSKTNNLLARAIQKNLQVYKIRPLKVILSVDYMNRDLRPGEDCLLSFSLDGTTITITAQDNQIRTWKIYGDNSPSIINVVGNITALEPNHNGEIIAVGFQDGSIELFDSATNSKLSKFVNPDNGSILDLEFSPDSELLAAVTENGSLYLWRIQDEQLQLEQQGNYNSFRKCTFSPDGSLIAAGGKGGNIFIFSAEEFTLLREIPIPFSKIAENEIFDLIFSSDGMYLIASSTDKTISIWGTIEE